nr:ORF1 [Flumine Bastrovirus 3]
MGADAKGTIRLAELGDDERFEQKTHKTYRFPVPTRVMVTKGHNKNMLLRTNLERLTHATKNMDENVCEQLSDRLFKNLADEFDWNLPENFHHQTFLEAIEKMTQRGHDMTDIKESVDWQEGYVNIVKSFLKAQQKPCLGKDPHSADKAGQGISAWDKTLNTLMSPWTRALEQVLVNQSHGRIRVMSQMTDLQVMAILEQDGQADDKFLDNDWTQFDSNQNNLTRAILLKALKEIGCPPVLLGHFEEQLKSRRICTAQSSLQVNDKKDSGAPHTLVDNCLFNLAICMDLMDGYRHLYIKGDDSLARGPDVSFNTEKMKYYVNTCGYKFKPNAAKSGQFVSFLVNTQGVALDLPRVTAKVLSRCYTDKDDFIKYQEAIFATMMHIKLESGVNMCKVNSLHYTDSVRCESEFDVLISFLYRFARKEIPFSELYQSEAIYHRTDAPVSSSKTLVPIKVKQSKTLRTAKTFMTKVIAHTGKVL